MNPWLSFLAERPMHKGWGAWHCPPGDPMAPRIDYPEASVLRVADDFDSTQLVLTADEAFLLSRIDGVTAFGLLVEMTRIDAGRAARCLSDWLAQGVVEKVPGNRPGLRASSPTPRPGVPGIEESLIDPDLDIDSDTQRRILEFETKLGGSYHERLGVEPDADLRAIKRAYFELSREFHPDRFFRCELGPYTERLSLIFKMIVEAYEVLSDSVSANPEGADQGGGGLETDPLGSPRFDKLERLGQRVGANFPPALGEARRQKAREFFETAQLSARAGCLDDAVTGMEFAIRFDPQNRGYRDKLAEFKLGAAESRALCLLDESAGYGVRDRAELGSILDSLDRAVESRPRDPELSERSARVALSIDELPRARGFAESAVDENPDVARFHTTLGLVYRAEGHLGHAVREFRLALERDPNDCEASRELHRLSGYHRSGPAGGGHG